ncbi:hypothetical protein BWGOE3_34520 [Bacillus mycoides]|uniref:restriction endonuclease subunit S n=1 Tax=Bacillus mycoides TaxID=1405 RepID=UPI000871F628|nr:restriction endonuclease subunit S [Bacillus mycoides]OFD42199.1 hypothetical protein BWGOE3_34520 [Bacillus mycoides]
MSDQITKSPQIRCAGFTDAWEQRKLGEFVQDYVEKTIVQNQYPVLTSSQRHGIILQEEYFADRQVTTQNNIGYFVLPRGYFTYRSRSDNGVFKFNRNDIVDKGIISYFYPVFKISNGNSDFFLNMLNSTTKKQVALEAEGTGQKVLSLNKFKNINVVIPEAKEQTKIGNFFKQLDDTIILHQRRLELLKDTKKSLLQKMFPRDGANIPEIRFAGFTDVWEQCALKKVAEFNPKSPLPNEFEYVDLESVSGTALVTHRTEKKETAPSRAQRLAQKGDVFYQTVRPYQRNNYLFDLPYNNYVFSTGYAQMRPNIDSYFLLNCIQEEKFVQHVLDRSTGTSYPAINSTDLAEINIQVPVNTDEQTKIGCLFKKLDQLITLHQRELNLLKNLKKSLLQQMFV